MASGQKIGKVGKVNVLRSKFLRFYRRSSHGLPEASSGLSRDATHDFVEPASAPPHTKSASLQKEERILDGPTGASGDTLEIHEEEVLIRWSENADI